MKKKKAKQKSKKLIINLSMRDYEKLSSHAKANKTRPSLDAKRMLHAYLSALSVEKKQQQPKNQLGLFDFPQIDIFNQLDSTNNN